jgi:steroid delta-isomerase-like uncharacterized protein
VTGEAAPHAVVARLYDAYNRHDVDAVIDCWHPQGREFLPLAGEMSADPGLRAHLGQFWAAFPDAAISVRSITSDDERAVAQVDLAGTFSGARFQGLVPNGRRWVARMAEVFEVHAGVITRADVYMDSLDLMRQIGLMPPEGNRFDDVARVAFNLRTRAVQRLAVRRRDREAPTGIAR